MTDPMTDPVAAPAPGPTTAPAAAPTTAGAVPASGVVIAGRGSPRHRRQPRRPRLLARGTGGAPPGFGRRAGQDRRRELAASATVVDEPALTAEVTAGQLDADVRRDLRGLQKETAERVARHLVAAGSLVDVDPELALAHARYARFRASRIAVVREAAGIAAYHAGEWSEALGELRAARRMGGGPGHLAVMADIERALGRPERALDLTRGPEAAELDRAERIELAIVAAGARRDLGEVDASVVGLQIPELDPTRRDPWSARLFYAYADNLLAAGRESDALQWFVHTAHADDEGETDAEQRIAELTGEDLPDDGVDFVEEDETAAADRPGAPDVPTEVATTEVAADPGRSEGTEPADGDAAAGGTTGATGAIANSGTATAGPDANPAETAAADSTATDEATAAEGPVAAGAATTESDRSAGGGAAAPDGATAPGATDSAPTDGPDADGSATDGLATDGPATDGLATDGPATDGPATDGPATDGPEAADDGEAAEAAASADAASTVADHAAESGEAGSADVDADRTPGSGTAAQPVDPTDGAVTATDAAAAGPGALSGDTAVAAAPEHPVGTPADEETPDR